MERQHQAVKALELLETIPVPPDFADRVLSRLPETVPVREPAPPAPAGAPLARLREAWRSALAALANAGNRRRLVPVLAVAASLLLMLGLVYGLWIGPAPVVPGAAVGASPWLIGGGAILIAGLLAAALIVWRRKG